MFVVTPYTTKIRRGSNIFFIRIEKGSTTIESNIKVSRVVQLLHEVVGIFK